MDIDKVVNNAKEEFMLFCQDDARPRDLVLLQSILTDAIREQNESLGQDLSDEMSRSLVMKVITDLLNNKKLYSFYSGEFSSVYHLFPVVLPSEEIIRRITAEWSCMNRNKLGYFDCASFLSADAPETRISPFLKSIQIYNDLLSVFMIINFP